MKPFRTLCIAAMLAATFAIPAFAAKVDDPSLYTPEALKKNLVLGKTTKEQVRAIYGEPDYVDRTSAKEGGYERAWSYFPTESRGEKVRREATGFLRGMIPGGRASVATDKAQDFGVGSRNVKSFTLHVYYDKNGVLSDYSQDEKNESKNVL